MSDSTLVPSLARRSWEPDVIYCLFQHEPVLAGQRLRVYSDSAGAGDPAVPGAYTVAAGHG